MNVVEALVVTLGIDPKDLISGLQKAQKSLESFAGKESQIDKQRNKEQREADRKRMEAERKAAKEREAQLKAAAEGYSKVRNAILGMVGATLTAAGLKSFVTGSVDGLIAMKRASTNLGMSVREVDAWGRAVASVGGNKDAILQTMQNIRGSIEAFRNGLDMNSPTIKALGAMGVAYQDAQGNIRSMKDMLPEIADALQKYTPQQQLLLADQLSIDPDTLQLLRQGGDAVRKLYAQQYELSRATEEGAQKAIAFKAKWAEIKSNFESTGQSVFLALVPALERLNELLLMFANWVSAHSTQIGSFFSGLADLLAGVVGFFSQLHEKTDGWSTKILAAVAALMALKGVIGGILSMTGLPMLMKLLGGGAAAAPAGGAGLGLASKLGIAGVASWAALKVAKAAGLPDTNTAQGADAIRNGQWWRASALLPAGEFASALKDKALGKSNAEIAGRIARDALKKQVDQGEKQIEQGAEAGKAAQKQNDWLQKIESGISKMNEAFKSGAAGAPNPTSGFGAGAAYAAGGIVGTVVNSAFGQIMKKAEGDYNVANFKKADGRLGVKRFDHNNMTVGQVMAAQARGEMFATGRYQIIPETLKGAVSAMGLKGNEKYDQTLQDRIFVEYLLKNKRKAIWNYIHGKSNDLRGAMLAASQEWSSFAAPAGAKTRRGFISDGSMSFYHGNGVDRASVGAAQSAAMFQQLRAQVMAQNGGVGNRTEVQINGGITINTAAKDANSIAQEIRPAVNRHLAGVTALGMG